MTVRLLFVCGGSGIGLLGHQRTLGVHAEFYIDASEAVRSRTGSARGHSTYSIELERRIGTLGSLFQEARNWTKGNRPSDPGGAPYLWTVVEDEASVRHLRFLMNHLPATLSLERGLAGSPALGGLIIRHPDNRAALEMALEKATAPLGVGPENPVEAWIVSSTVGGVGGGVHRFVGAFLADFLRRRYTDTSLILNFIRIGPLTYRSVNPRQTALNTFFGVAADAVYAQRLSRDFPGTANYWFYVDLPDVGIGPQSVSTRTRMVEIAAKTMMLEDIQGTLRKLLTYNQGLPVVLARIGYWEENIAEERKYYEAVRQLREQLREFAQPDYLRKYVRVADGKPKFVAPKLEDRVKRLREEDILRQIEAGWRFPWPGGRRPKDLQEARTLIRKWENVMAGLLGQRWDDLEGEWALEGPLGDRVLRTPELGIARPGDEIWFRQIEEAHRARAWARFLLGYDAQTGHLYYTGGNGLTRLWDTARRIAIPLHGFHFQPILKRVRASRELLVAFAWELGKAGALLRLEEQAGVFLEKELFPLYQCLEVAESDFQNLWSRWAQPDYGEYIQEDRRPWFSPSEALPQWRGLIQDVGNLQSRWEQGWRLPADLRAPRSLVDVRSHVQTWKTALQDLLGLEWTLLGGFWVRGESGEETLPLEKMLSEPENDGWSLVKRTHFVRAWACHLLGCDVQSGQPLWKPETLLGTLYRQARDIAFNQVLARIPIRWCQKTFIQRLGILLGEFFTVLAQVDCLLQLEEMANQLLERELQEEPLVAIGNLSDRYGETTWFQALYEAMRYADPIYFRKAVFQGISGLSKRGVQHVLGLSGRVSAAEVSNELLSRMGKMKVNGEAVEAPWWAETPVSPAMSFECRLFPFVPSDLQEQLLSVMGEKGTVFCLFGFPELSVVACSAISVAHEMGDVLTAPTTLLKPLIPAVRSVLSEWDYISAYNVPVRQLEIVSAGVSGEPLFGLALQVGGLSEEEISKIEQFYPIGL